MAARSGSGTSTWRSNLPGRRIAGSSAAGSLQAPTRMTPPAAVS